MKIVIRAVLDRYELAPGTDRPEPTGRRAITFSPRLGARVILAARAAAERRPSPEFATSPA
jgi:hypothetical protein